MTAEKPNPTSRDELNAELISLLARAHNNDVEIKGGWECRNGDSHPDWDVVITELVDASSD